MLLDEIKGYVRIAGDGENANLETLIARGKAKLEGLTGTALGFDDEGLPRSLLFDYVRYAFNNASEYFEENFQREILRLQLQSAVSENEDQS